MQTKTYPCGRAALAVGAIRVFIGHATALLTALCLFAMSAAHAGIADSPRLTGDWDGARSTLEDRGIDLEGYYFTEFATNFSGGSSNKQAYAAELGARASFDLSRLWGWEDTSFDIKLTNRQGDGLNEKAELHELMQSQPIYGRGNITRISLLRLQKKWLDQRLTLKLGRLPVGDEFDVFPCEFMLLALCGPQPGNVFGSTIYNGPISQWAGVVRYDVTPDFYVSFGAYQIDPGWLSKSHGLSLDSPRGTIGTLVPAEMGWRLHPGGLAGLYKLGGWYENAGGHDLFEDENGQPVRLSGNLGKQRGHGHGLYFSAVQRLWQNAADPSRGLDLEFHWVQADPHLTTVDRLLTTGLVYHGLFNSRPGDMLGLGVANMHVNNRIAHGERLYNASMANSAGWVAVQDAERSFALFYHLQLAGSIYTSPELQYIHHPSGNSRYDDAVVLALRTVITF